MESDDPTSAKAAVVRRFEDWCNEHNCVMEKVQVASTAFGFGLRATKDVEPSEVALAIPLDLVLTIPVAARSSQALLRSETTREQRVSAQALMYVVMIHGWHDVTSKWHPYLRQIPSKHQDPLCWTQRERQGRLKGTQLLHEVQRHEAQLRSVHESIFPALSQELPEIFPEERYTFASFIWARSALASRCFAETHLKQFLGDHMEVEAMNYLRLTADEEARLTLDCPGVLCPLLDTGNHDPKVTIDLGLRNSEKNGLQLALARDSGNHRSNLQLLLGHGFCLPENPQDTVPLKLGKAAAESQEQEMARKLAGLVENEDRSLRVLLESAPSQKTMLSKLTTPIDVKLDRHAELDALRIFHKHLMVKQNQIQSGNPQTELVEGREGWARCHYAEIYRSGQLEILQAALKEVKARERAFMEDCFRDFPLPGADEALHCPVVAFYGKEDAAVSLSDVRRWEYLSSDPDSFQVIQMEGGHMWFQNSSTRCEALATELGRLVRVSRFYQSRFLLLLRQPRISTASSRAQWALPEREPDLSGLPDLNRERQSSVGTAGP
eukprot:s2498_g9.t2